MPSSFGCLLLRPKTPDRTSTIVSRIESVGSGVVWSVCLSIYPRVEPKKKLHQSSRTSSRKTVKSVVCSRRWLVGTRTLKRTDNHRNHWAKHKVGKLDTRKCIGSKGKVENRSFGCTDVTRTEVMFPDDPSELPPPPRYAPFLPSASSSLLFYTTLHFRPFCLFISLFATFRLFDVFFLFFANWKSP